MTRKTSDALIDASLRDLDAAPASALTDAQIDRAQAALARIMTTPAEGPASVAIDRPRPRWWRLLAPVGLVGAAGAAVPLLLFGGGDAFGTWTATPQTLTGDAAAEAATTCREAMAASDEGGRTVLAERRGGWTYVLIAGPDIEAACLMPNDLVGQVGVDGVLGSYTAAPSAPPLLERDGFRETSSMESSTDEGWFDEGWYVLVEGFVGDDVTGVTVHTSSGLDVKASVVDDRFAAWWPSVPQSSEQPAETWSYTVHLADGSTRSHR